MKEITPFLMFEGRAEEAINLYLSLIPNSRIISLTRFGAGTPGAEGSVQNALFSLNGQTFMAFDSFVKHAFTFTPSFSLFVQCESEEELDRLFDALSAGGGVMMAPGNHGFSAKFAWLADRFGVSWQLNLA